MASVLPFERLKGRENFATWKTGAKSYLITKGYWCQMGTALVEANKTLNERALAELILLVEPSVYPHLENCKEAKEGWDTLEKVFEDKGIVRKVTLLKQWISLRFSECSSMQEYVNQCLSLRSKVNNAGFNIDEDIAASIMLCGLSDEFKPLVMSMETKTLTVDYVTNYLLQEIEFSNNTTEKALVAQKKFKKDQKQKRHVKCYNCGGPHYKNKCPQLKNKNKSENCDVVLYSAFVAQNNLNNDWFIDSGATAHMTGTESFLINRSEPIVKEVAVANKQKLIK